MTGALERDVLEAVQLAIGGRDDVRLFRNTVGAVQTAAGQWLRYGLAPGSSDLIGWQRIIIKPEMVGLCIARFLAIEVKREQGADEPDNQTNFVVRVREAGGAAGFARSIGDAEAILRQPPTRPRFGEVSPQPRRLDHGR